MKKNIKIILSMVILCVLVVSSVGEAKAAVASKTVDGPYSVTGNEVSGQSTIKTRGIYLQDGFSSISRAGSGLITAGGGTNGQRAVSEITVNIEVQQLVGSGWRTYTMWTSTRYNATQVMNSKNLSVPKGYYYRVKCIHYANSDISSSFTDGLYIS